MRADARCRHRGRARAHPARPAPVGFSRRSRDGRELCRDRRPRPPRPHTRPQLKGRRRREAGEAEASSRAFGLHPPRVRVRGSLQVPCRAARVPRGRARARTPDRSHRLRVRGGSSARATGGAGRPRPGRLQRRPSRPQRARRPLNRRRCEGSALSSARSA